MGKDEMSPWISPRGSFGHKEPSKKDNILKCLFSELGQTSSWDPYGASNLLNLSTNYYTPWNMSSSGQQETWEDENRRLLAYKSVWTSLICWKLRWVHNPHSFIIDKSRTQGHF